jgi:hypothetical protein
MAKSKSVRDIFHMGLELGKQQAVKPYNDALHKYAEENSTWPIEIIKQITVKYEKGHHAIKFPQDIKDDIEDLENGSPGKSPSALLRNFMLEHR